MALLRDDCIPARTLPDRCSTPCLFRGIAVGTTAYPMPIRVSRLSCVTASQVFQCLRSLGYQVVAEGYLSWRHSVASNLLRLLPMVTEHLPSGIGPAVSTLPTVTVSGAVTPATETWQLALGHAPPAVAYLVSRFIAHQAALGNLPQPTQLLGSHVSPRPAPPAHCRRPPTTLQTPPTQGVTHPC